MKTLFFACLFALSFMAPLSYAHAEEPEAPEESLPPIDQKMLADLVRELQENPPPAISAKEGSAALQTAEPGQALMPAPLASTEPAQAAPSDFTRKILASSNPARSAVNDILDRDTSSLESAYGKRAKQALKQFGYDIFQKKSALRDVLAAAQDDFILGIGDTITLTYRGARNDAVNYTINREGQLLIEGLSPFVAANRSLKDVSAEIQSQIQTRLLNTEAYVSLDKVRQIGVQVLGEVQKPGRHDLNAISTLMDALNAAGGVKKTGSLRQITLSRGDGWARKIDLYQLLLTGNRETDLVLRDGDRILVPPIGRSFAITGDVKRAGIYELPDSNPRLSLQQALYLSGESAVPAGFRFQQSHIQPDGREDISGITSSTNSLIGDGDILFAQRFDQGQRGNIELSGEVRSPGLYAVDTTPTLQALLGDGGVTGNDVYPLMGVIERFDRKTLSTQLIPFSPDAIARGDADKALKEGDKVRLFSQSDMKQMVKQAAPLEQDNKRTSFGIAAPDSEEENEQTPLSQLLDQQKISVRGAVMKPGGYPAGQTAHLDQLIAAAGGLRANADKTAIEIVKAVKGEDWEAARQIVDLTLTDPSTITVPIGASVRVNQNLQVVSTRGVTIGGEVRRPGTYDLMRGEKLSSLIERAGGYTSESYPEAAVFTRESARRREAELFRRTADELDLALSRTMSGNEKMPSEDKINSARRLVNELRNSQAVGRITVEADPSVLAIRPEQDPLLEDGDKIFIPKRTVNVHVAGEVFSPASLKFSADKTAGEYITEAGGFTRLADDGKSFVVLPDGSAQPLSVSAWNHSNVQIPPGSTIIVPRDVDPVSFLEMTNSLGNIFTQLAISSAAVASINRDR